MGVRYILCPECQKRGLSHHPSKHEEHGVRVRCRYCKFETEMSSSAFWSGLWEHDPGVQEERAKQLRALNDRIREEMEKTGATKVRLKRIGRTNDYKIEVE